MYATKILIIAICSSVRAYEKGEYEILIDAPSSLPVGSTLTLTCITVSDTLPRAITLARWKQKTSLLDVVPKEKLVHTKLSNGKVLAKLLYKKNNVSLMDADDYTCSAGTADYNTTHKLKIYSENPPDRPPSNATLHHWSISLSIKKNLTMLCTLQDQGYPGATFRWYTKLEGQVKLLETRTKWLELNVTSIHDSGPYFCQGVNRYGNSSISEMMELSVKTPLHIESGFANGDILHPVYTNNSFTVNTTVSGTDIGERSLSPCFAKSAFMGDCVSTVPNIIGNFSYGQTTARMYTVTPRLDQHLSCWNVDTFDGKYRFQVQKRYPLQRSDAGIDVQFEIEVHYPAIWNGTWQNASARLGDHNVSVFCDVCAKPSVIFIWKLNDRTLPNDVIVDQSESRILISEVQSHHFGVYKCIATNTINEQENKRSFEIKLLQIGNDEGVSTETTYYALSGGLFCVILLVVVVLSWKNCHRRQDVKAVPLSSESEFAFTENEEKVKAETQEMTSFSKDSVECPINDYSEDKTRVSHMYAEPITPPRQVQIVKDGLLYSEIQITPRPK